MAPFPAVLPDLPPPVRKRETMTTIDNTKKAAALKLLSRGLITPAEATRLAGVSRQLALYWAKGVDAEQKRALHLSKLWSKQLSKIAPK